MPEERLQKILRSAGITSRRKAEALISAGRVRVDGQIVTEMGIKANPRKAKVELDGRRLQPEPFCYGVVHKPRGMLSTLSDPEGRPTAQDILRQVGVRVVPIGRLDFNTSGVLLFTNDGDFAHALSHASGNVPKVYAAKVQQIVDEDSLAKWAEVIEIEGSKTRPAQIRILRREGDKTWLEVTLAEGKNHQVRRLGEHAKTPVVRLSRLSHAEITCEGLRPGQWRLLSVDELKTLKKRYGVPKKIHAQADALAAWTPSKSAMKPSAAGSSATRRPVTTASLEPATTTQIRGKGRSIPSHDEDPRSVKRRGSRAFGPRNVDTPTFEAPGGRRRSAATGRSAASDAGRPEAGRNRSPGPVRAGSQVRAAAKVQLPNTKTMKSRGAEGRKPPAKVQRATRAKRPG